MAKIPTIREALARARFPAITIEGRRMTIADLRCHANGKPTLAFVITTSEAGEVTDARLDRGGSVRELLRRWFQRADPSPGRQRICTTSESAEVIETCW
jgi:hypothetical protein